MTSTSKKVLFSVLQWVCVVLVVFLLWHVVAVVQDNPLLYPDLADVLAQTGSLLLQGETYLSLCYTLLRSLVAFAVSVVVAFALAVCAGLFNSSKKIIDVIVLIFRSVPTMAIIFIALMMFSSSAVPCFVAVLVAFPVAYSAFVRETSFDDKLNEVCDVYEVTKRKKLKYVLLPQIKNAFLPQCKDSLPLCIKVVIAGEALSLPLRGLGKDMYSAKVSLETAQVLALTILTLVVCLIIQSLFGWLEKKYGSV